MDKLPSLNPQNLVVFYLVVKEGNLTSAAERLHFTQPGISYHIRALESYTNLKLLDIKKQRLVLTPAGETIYKYAKEIYQQLIAMENFIRSLRESSLIFGVAGIFLNVVAPVLNLFAKQHPEVKLTVRSGETLELVRDVQESKLDFAVVLKSDCENEKMKHLTICSSKKLICFASPEITLSKGPIVWSELNRYPLVVGSENSVVTKIIINKYLEKGLDAPKYAIAVNVPHLLKRSVQNGEGIGFMFMEDIEKEVSLGLLQVIQLEEGIYVGAEVILRSDVVINPMITEFAQMLENTFRS
jgi:DNA-binding transcriptional LysR family regulator